MDEVEYYFLMFVFYYQYVYYCNGGIYRCFFYELVVFVEDVDYDCNLFYVDDLKNICFCIKL